MKKIDSRIKLKKNESDKKLNRDIAFFVIKFGAVFKTHKFRRDFREKSRRKIKKA